MDTLATDSMTIAAHTYSLAPQDFLASQSDTNHTLVPGAFDTPLTAKNNAHRAQHPITTGKLFRKMNMDGNTEVLSQLEFSTTEALVSKGHPGQDYQQQLETGDMSPAIISCKMHEPAGEKHEEVTNDNINNSSSSTTHFTTNPSFTTHALPFPVPSSPVQEVIMLHPNITQHHGGHDCRSDKNSTGNEGEGSDTNNSPAAPAGAKMNSNATTGTTGTTGTGTKVAVASSTAASGSFDIARERERAVTDLGREKPTDHHPHSSSDTDNDSNSARPSLLPSPPLAAMTTMPVTGRESQLSAEQEDAKERDSVLRPSIVLTGETMATTNSSSSSSLSEYLLIGQEQVEKEDIEGDLHSERSFSSASQNSFDDFRYHQEEGAANYDRPPSSYSNYSVSSSNQSQDEYEYEDLLENPSMYRPHSPSQQQREQREQQNRPSRTKRSSRRRAQYSEEQDQGPAEFKQSHQRITENAGSSSSTSDRDREGRKSAAPSSSATSSSTAEENTRKRRSYRASVNNFDEFEDYDDPDNQTSQGYSSSPSLPTKTPSTPATSTPVLPALKIPSVRGLTRSIFEFIVASVVCLSLISCMFAFSYVSTGANRLVGWYSDQKIGQRFRDGIKEREHFVQETLEKMAGEEYAKVKRQSRQYGQQPHSQHHQQQQYQNRYQQQYQQDRDQRYQQQQQQREQQERGRLSPAEWQELIRAASMSFMAKFSSAPESVPGFGRR